MSDSPIFPLIFGTSALGKEGTTFSHFHTLEEVQAIADLFASRGGSAFDTSNAYGNGTSQEYLAKVDLKGLPVDTKIAPHFPGAHAPEALRKAVQDAANALAPHKIRILYLHYPDRSVPYEDTLREIDALHKEGYFEQFGLSNYYSWEVAEMYTISKLKGWVLPTVYQGRYNAMERITEEELFPCLRRFGIAFYAYSPLAGGLLSGKWNKPEDMDNINMVAGTRFDTITGNTVFQKLLYNSYKNVIPSFAALTQALDAAKIPPAEAALRWIQHHSALKPGDAVIIGASKMVQIENNLKYSALGPLPENIVQLIDKASQSFKQYVTGYCLR
ncbi:Aldo/keto reductase [Gymnopus androsaceus JB14]|uniref:Aldo/keto reductase n=1 Tax=Gymnopus androsaceus JB14 TaxID=1447944 RepID=A0A6A4HIZ2_9AGAR|nr:Aldo/keto reductase [Gymnopus androsaceus JB14]KAE9396855.1 Aldo/keto reductase [Gymnopus androsaceus JB14]